MRGVVGGLALLGGMASAAAADFSFTGSLLVGRQVQFFDFTQAAPGIINIRTFHAAGGTNGAGTAIPTNGFDPQLFLFDAIGNILAGNDDTFGLDSSIVGVLQAGNYRLAMTKFNNDPVGVNLSSGFLFQNTSDGFGTRTKNWAVDIRGVTTATVVAPVTPANLACMRSAIGGIEAASFSGPAQRNVLLGLVNVSATYLGTPYPSLSAAALASVIARSNGCGETGNPDSIQRGGMEVDFVTSCPAQDAILACLRTPLP